MPYQIAEAVMMQGLLPPAGCGGIVGILDWPAAPMLCRIPNLLTISAGKRADGVSACRGQGRGRTADLPLFRSTALSAVQTCENGSH